ncbi:MAG: VWA domain-containing protein [Planctomycetota bacterium]
MQFDNPYNLWLLLLPVALVGFYVFVFRRKRQAAERFASHPLVQSLISGVSRRKQQAKAGMIVGAALLMVLAHFEPMWGFRHEKVQRQGVDIVVAVDTSRSMLAMDVKPSRMERAKLEVIDLLRALDGDRVALVAFAGEAYMKCPLTEDYETVEVLLKGIDVGVIPQGSTNIGHAVRRSMQAFHDKERKHKVLILITDGEDHGYDPTAAAVEAARLGVAIFTVGIGTKEGTHIQVVENGERMLLTDEKGEYVKSQLNETLLGKICETANARAEKSGKESGADRDIKGYYIPAYDPQWSLEKVYETSISAMEKRKFGPRWVKKYINRYQWPLLAAVVLLTLEAVMSDGRRENRSRRRERWQKIG